MSQVIAHRDTHLVSEEVVRAEPRPAFTESWHPFSHGEVIDAMTAACKKSGFEVGRKQYSIRPGAKMFAAWDLKKVPDGLAKWDEKEFALSIGFRNGINKSLAIGLCAGERIFVCDNLVLSGQVVLFRKHTGLLEYEEIIMQAVEALGRLAPGFQQVINWHGAMKDVSLTDAQVSTLLVAAMRREHPIVPPAQFSEFDGLYFDHDSKYPKSLWGFHGAITEMYKDTSMVDYMKRTRRLVQFVDHEVPALLAEHKKNPVIIPFGAIEVQGGESFQTAQAERKEDARISGKEIKAAVKAQIAEKKNGTKAQAKAEKKAAKASAKQAAPKVSPKAEKPKGKAAKAAKPVFVKPQRANKAEKAQAVKVEAAKARLATPKEIAVTPMLKETLGALGSKRFGCGLKIKHELST